MARKTRAEDEIAAAADTAAQDEEIITEKSVKQGKDNGFIQSVKQIGSFAEKAKSAIPVATDFYNHWLKPLYDNRAQIKRRLNMTVTLISAIFFVLYIPILLFNKLAKGLSLGWDIALYTCVGVYAVTLVTLIVVTVVSGKSTSTEVAKRRRKAGGIILFIVRLASLAMAITAIIISGNGENTALDTIVMVLAIVSIVFTALSLIFGGAVEFFKWLISPAKIKRTFSFVALEWNQSIQDVENPINKAYKKATKRYAEKINTCLDSYLLPALGEKQIKSVDGEDIEKVLGGVPEQDLNMTEWLFKEVFSYAHDCGYVEVDPCLKLELEGDIELEARKMKEAAKTAEEPKSVLGRLASIFRRRGAPEDDLDDGDDER